MGPGETVTVLADDPLASVDIPHFCAEAGHTVKQLASDGDSCVFLVTAGEKIPGPR